MFPAMNFTCVEWRRFNIFVEQNLKRKYHFHVAKPAAATLRAIILVKSQKWYVKQVVHVCFTVAPQ